MDYRKLKLSKSNNLRIILLAFSGFFYISITHPLLAQTPNQSYFWQAYDETEELLQQAEHDNARMRYRLLNSKYLDKNSLWNTFEDELSDFSDADYQALKPLIIEQDIPGLQRAVAEQRLSYELIVKFFLHRIRLFESDNAQSLNAIIATNPDAIAQARMRDRARATGELVIEEQSLFGIPVLLKDNIGTEGIPTTAGALALQNNYTSDAFITTRLKANGAIILGKANLSEWAYFFCDRCPLGYSALGGQTLNPYGRGVFESGGSSSGSAVAVAANLVPVAVGSETSGSILSPSSLNSVVGLKPTTGMLSRTGVVPISGTLDTTGPIAKNLGDAVILFNAMAGFDEQDLAMPLLSADAQLIHREVGLGAKRMGYFANLTSNELYNGVLGTLREAGVELVEIEMPDVQLVNFGDFLGAEMKTDLAAYLVANAGDEVAVSSVEEVMAFNNMDAARRAPYGQGRFDALQSANYSPEQVDEIRSQIRSAGAEALSRPLQEHNLDALLSVNNSHAAFAAAANFPALTIPMGYRESGVPAGITLISSSFSEQELVDIGITLEALLQARRLPVDYQ